eukprot:599068-Pelagomonas_calceolata.AAC.1
MELNVPDGSLPRSVHVSLRCVTEDPIPEATMARAAEYPLRPQKDSAYLGIGGSDSHQCYFKGSQGVLKPAESVVIRSVDELDELMVDDQLHITCRMKDTA